MSAPQVTPDVRSTSPNAHLTSLYATLTASLAPGETLLWWGQPDPKRIVTRSFDAGLMVYCAVIAVGLSALIAYAAAQNPDKLSSPGFWAGATLTLALPLYGLVGRLLVRRWVRRRTLYGVTPARVITVSAALGTPAATSAWHAAIPLVRLRLRRNDAGSIDFKTRVRDWPPEYNMPYMDIAFPSFDDISGAAAVFNLLGGLRFGRGMMEKGRGFFARM